MEERHRFAEDHAAQQTVQELPEDGALQPPSTTIVASGKCLSGTSHSMEAWAIAKWMQSSSD